MIWRGFCGFLLGVVAAGIVVTIASGLGLPEGPGWWALIIPFLLFMTYAGAITE